MQWSRLEEAVAEAERFLSRAKPLLKKRNKESKDYIGWEQSPQYTAAVGRSSLDLSKSLSRLRQDRQG
jgi:hypothetical protein